MYYLYVYVDFCFGYYVIFWFFLGVIRWYLIILDFLIIKDNDIEMGLIKVI